MRLEGCLGRNCVDKELPYLPCIGLKSRSIATRRHVQSMECRKMRSRNLGQLRGGGGKGEDERDSDSGETSIFLIDKHTPGLEDMWG